MKFAPSPQTHAEKTKMFHIPSCNTEEEHNDEVESKPTTTTTTTSKSFVEKSHRQQTNLGSPCLLRYLVGAVSRNSSAPDDDHAMMHISKKISFLCDTTGQSHSFHTLSRNKIMQ